MIQPQEHPVKTHVNKIRYCMCFNFLSAVLFFTFMALAFSSCMSGCLGNSSYNWPCTSNNVTYCCKTTFSPELTSSCGSYSDCELQQTSCDGYTVAAWIFGSMFVLGIIGLIIMSCNTMSEMRRMQPHYQGMGVNNENSVQQWNQQQPAYPNYANYGNMPPNYGNRGPNYGNQPPNYFNQRLPDNEYAAQNQQNPYIQRSGLRAGEPGQGQAYIYDPPTRSY